MNVSLDISPKILLLLIPVIIIQVGLMIVALTDLIKRERTRGPKWVWALVIVLVNIFGPVAYLLFGREE
ncbi:MAG: transcriptional regulator [Candidatus Aminicenantes bacterium RBG_13_62_12]|nr:MAG: transcriptional regulator [Candidatus Aminicenantes bacterium RBG_13_62_12]